MQEAGDPPISAGRNREVLVTGGAGFIGSALVAELLAAGARVVVVDDLSTGRLSRLPRHDALEFQRVDLCRPGALERALGRRRSFHTVFHLAARLGVRAVLRDPEGCRRDNLAATGELLAYLEALAPEDRGRLLAASTSEVYRERREPLREGFPLRSVHGVGRWSYAASKILAEQLIDERRALWPVDAAPLHLRFFNVVGPGQDSAGGMVLPHFIERARAGLSLPVHGRGEAVRTFAHVAEVGATLRALGACRSLPGGPLNVGGVARSSILALARLVLEAVPEGRGVEFVDPRRHLCASFEGIAHREPDLARLRGLGLPVPALDLASIVRDCALHHPREETRFAASQAAGSQAESDAPCASPAS